MHRARVWLRQSKMSAIIRKRAAASLNSDVHHLMPTPQACLYMRCMLQVCQRQTRRIEKAWLSCSRRNIPTAPGSLDLILFQSNVISKADFRLGGINGFLPPEPVGRRWPLRRPCLREKSSHKRHSAAEPQPNVDDVAVWTELECVIFPSSQRRGGCAIKKMPRSHKSGADGREARAR